MARATQKQVTWHFEVLPKATKKALEFLSAQKWLKQTGWYLAGGTGLALQVGHRESVDLDFFNQSIDFSEGRLVKRFKKTEWQTTFIKERTIYGKLLGAKVSFIGYPFFIPGEKPVWFGNVRVLQPRDIAIMKIIAISQRGKKRDFVDLYWYGQNQEPLDEIVPKLFKQYPNINHNLHHILKSLTYFDDAEKDPMPNLNFAVNWPQIKAYFRREVPRLTRKLLELK